MRTTVKLLTRLFVCLALMQVLSVPASAITVTFASTTVAATTTYPGSTCTLRIYANPTFTASDGTTVMGGAPPLGAFFKVVNCTIASGVITIPSFTLPSTTDAIDNQNARYTAVFYDSKGVKRDTFLADFTVPSSFGANVTWAQIKVFKAGSQPFRDTNVYTRTQTNLQIQQALSDVSVGKATTTSEGVSRVSVAPADPVHPIAVETGDPRVPTQAENDALQGTNGSPSNSNRYVTNTDPRLGGTGANPTASVGLTPVNGVATTMMRSDAAPPLDQSIAPTWTGVHTFNAAKLVTPDIGPSVGQRHTVPAVASDTLALIAATQALTNKTYNGLTINQTSGSFTISNAKTLNVSNSLNLSGTDGKALTLTGGLTVGGDTSITGGGTFALGSFTFTVPATGTAVITSRTITEGVGLAGNVYDLSANRTLALGMPSTVGVSSTNSVSGQTHNHAVSSSSNPGGTASLLASDVGGNLQLVGLTLSGTFSPSGTVFGHLIPFAPDTFDLGSSVKPWRRGWISEIDAVLFVENTVTAIGGWVMIAKGEGTADEDIDNSETQIDFGANNIAANDFIIFRTSLAVEYMQATALVSGNTWTVTRNVDGSGANAWPQGAVWVNLGNNGSGRIELNANSTPRIQVIRQGATYNSGTTVGQFGDLNGSYGYSAETYGLGVGEYGVASQSWLTIDQLNGLRAGSNTTTRILLNPNGSGFVGNGNVSWSTTGDFTISGNANIAGWAVNSTNFAKDTGTNSTSAGMAPADFPFFAGATVANRATAPFRVTPAGALTATNATITGTIIAPSGSIGGFDIGSDYLRDTANSFGLASTVTGSDDVRFWAGNTFANRTTAPFRLTEGGVLTANNANITGAITVTSGSVTGNFAVSGAGVLSAGGGDLKLDVNGITIEAGFGSDNKIKFFNTAGGNTTGEIYTSTNGIITVKSGDTNLSNGIVELIGTTSYLGGYTTTLKLHGSIEFSANFAALEFERDVIGEKRGLTIGSSSAPATNAILDLATTKGALLLTRLTTTERDAFSALNGMIIYNTTTGKFQGRAGGAWVDLH